MSPAPVRLLCTALFVALVATVAAYGRAIALFEREEDEQAAGVALLRDKPPPGSR